MANHTSTTWESLLLLQRFGAPATTSASPTGLVGSGAGSRHPWQMDYDRIVFSRAFRRMQGKTQVVPLPDSDFVHTRLTHSLEVSSVGRSLGDLVGQKLEAEMGPSNAANLGSLVATVCLAHDIGNPPFGHSGEEAIQYWFGQFLPQMATSLLPEHAADLLHFEGNAVGFRYLVRGAEHGGMRLTMATLASFAKYPCTRMHVGAPIAAGRADAKKFGVFADDFAYFETIAQKTGMVPLAGACEAAYCRHPCAWLMEAADDVCYAIIDLEDAAQLGLLSYEHVEALLLPLAERSQSIATSGQLRDRLHTLGDAMDRIAYLRSLAINALVQELVEVFSSNLSAILEGTQKKALKDEMSADAKAAYKEIIDISIKHIYQAPQVVQLELTGRRVLCTLMDMWASAALEPETNLSSKIRGLLPSPLQARPDAQNPHACYQYLLGLACHLASFTDAMALQLYRKYMGIEL